VLFELIQSYMLCGKYGFIKAEKMLSIYLDKSQFRKPNQPITLKLLLNNIIFLMPYHKLRFSGE